MSLYEGVSAFEGGARPDYIEPHEGSEACHMPKGGVGDLGPGEVELPEAVVMGRQAPMIVGMHELEPNHSVPSAPTLGVDIGGTKIAVVVGTARGEVIAREQLATEPLLGPEDACDRIAQAASRVSEGLELHEVVGVSAPGPLSSRGGRFLNPPNMPSWHGFEITAALESRLERSVRLMNDANASALAEWRFGAGKGTETMIFFTMSTGMGAGLIIGGQLHEGPDDMAGEVGHSRLERDGPVGFGRRGSLEGYCSGPGMAQLTVLRLIAARHDERDSVLFHLDKDFRLVDARDLGTAAKGGDAVALGVLKEVGKRLGQFSAQVVDLLNPEVIVVGTIGRVLHEYILPAARREIDGLAHPSSARRVELRPAALGEQTGDLAAVCAALTSTSV